MERTVCRQYKIRSTVESKIIKRKRKKNLIMKMQSKMNWFARGNLPRAGSSAVYITGCWRLRKRKRRKVDRRNVNV